MNRHIDYQKILIYIAFFTTGTLMISCANEDRPDTGGKIQVSEQQINDPNALNKEGSPIVFDAIERGDLTQVKRLVKAGMDIEKQGFGNQTPALVAASTDQWDICLYLLKQGADPTVADHSGLTIPYLAFNARIIPTSYQGKYWSAKKGAFFVLT